MCMVWTLALSYTFSDTHLSLAQSTYVPSPLPERAPLPAQTPAQVTLMPAPALAAAPTPKPLHPNCLPSCQTLSPLLLKPFPRSPLALAPPLPEPWHSPLVSEQLLPVLAAPFRASAPTLGYLANPQPGPTTEPERRDCRAGARAERGSSREAGPGRPRRRRPSCSGISFCHAESSALGQNKAAGEKAPLCLV